MFEFKIKMSRQLITTEDLNKIIYIYKLNEIYQNLYNQAKRRAPKEIYEIQYNDGGVVTERDNKKLKYIKEYFEMNKKDENIF